MTLRKNNVQTCSYKSNANHKDPEMPSPTTQLAKIHIWQWTLIASNVGPRANAGLHTLCLNIHNYKPS